MKKKILAQFLILTMILSSTFSGLPVYATETDTTIEDSITENEEDMTKEEITSEETTEDITTEELTTEISSETITTEDFSESSINPDEIIEEETILLGAAPNSSLQGITITLDGNGGTFSGRETTTVNGKAGYHTTLPTPTYDTYQLKGWELEDGTIITDNKIIMPDHDMTVSALYHTF